MTQQLGMAVNPDDLDNLGVQLDKAGATLSTALGDPTRFTGIPPEAFGPATNVMQNYHDLATQFVGDLNSAVQNLHSVGQLVHGGAQEYRQIEAANQARVKRASPPTTAAQSGSGSLSPGRLGGHG